MLDQLLESAGAEDWDHEDFPVLDDPSYMKGWMRSREQDRQLLEELDADQRKGYPHEN